MFIIVIDDNISAAAKNKQYLRMMGITHVLNTAEGTRFGQVDTGHGYYRDMPALRLDLKHNVALFHYTIYLHHHSLTTYTSYFFL